VDDAEHGECDAEHLLVVEPFSEGGPGDSMQEPLVEAAPSLALAAPLRAPCCAPSLRVVLLPGVAA